MNYKTMNIVTVVPLSVPLNLQQIYELVPIINVNYTMEGKKPKIPYFGLDNVIIGVRYKMKNRGVRKNGKQLRNVVAIDLQCENKNVHIKISRGHLQQTGATSHDMADRAFAKMVSHLVMVNDNYKYLFGQGKQTLQESVDYLFSCTNNDGEVINYDNPKFERALSEAPVGVDKRIVMTLSMYLPEYNSHDEYKQKVMEILDFDKIIYDGQLTKSASRICNGIYSHRYEKSVSLIAVGKLFNDLGYGVCYHNWHSSKSIKIMKIIEDGSVVKKKNRIPAHRFLIYQKGYIQQSSPTEKEVAEAAMAGVVECLNSIA